MELENLVDSLEDEYESDGKDQKSIGSECNISVQSGSVHQEIKPVIRSKLDKVNCSRNSLNKL